MSLGNLPKSLKMKKAKKSLGPPQKYALFTINPKTVILKTFLFEKPPHMGSEDRVDPYIIFYKDYFFCLKNSEETLDLC